MSISRAVPNIRSERPAETRDLFVDVLGFEVAMDMGWVVTVGSPTNPSAQVTIVGNEEWGVRRFMLREPSGTVVNVLSHRSD